ncbi:MAG: hypothetical protein LUI02_03015 [Clostridiales bacterium]|nr:hypothetical protein [Clostridiales bacterium]
MAQNNRKAGAAPGNEFFDWVENNKSLSALIVFCAVAVVMACVAIFAIGTPAVPMCVLLILEVGIAALLHRAELWIHAILLIAEIVAGILAGRVWVIVLCAIVYVCATAVLMISSRDDE